MTLTRAYLNEISEDELRANVLVPLFRAMGYRDVYQYHGGSLEQGKDIVMWKSGEIRERVNYGIVAKASRVSGQASGNSSAAEVRFQIEQCLSAPYPDPVTTQEQRVDHCFVVSSREITKEALNAIQDVLSQNRLDRIVDFVDGDRLWDLIEKYLPERAVWGKLAEVQEVLDNVSPHYRLIASTAAGTVTLAVQPKYPGAEREQPLTVKARFIFPNTPEGREKLTAFENHIRTGAPVTLSDPYLQRVEWPEFLQHFLPSGPGILTIGPVTNPVPVAVRIELEAESGLKAALEHTELRMVRAGIDEATFESAEQLVPWIVSIVLNLPEKRLQFHFRARYVGATVRHALEAWRFRRAMVSGGILRIVHLDTGLEIVRSPFGPQILEAPPELADEKWGELLEKLLYIQSRTHIPMVIPDDGLPEEEVPVILETAEKLRTGRASLDVNDWTIAGNKELARSLLAAFESSNPLALRFQRDSEVIIMGKHISLGPEVVTLEKAAVSDDDLALLRTEIATAGPDDTLKITVRPAEDSVIEAEYPKWLALTHDAISNH